MACCGTSENAVVAADFGPSLRFSGMKVILAKHAGFCFGVRRALDLVMRAAESGPIETLGPLIHNPQVVNRLAESGVRVVADLEDVSSGRVVIPSHGLPEDVLRDARQRGLQVVDAACPFVKRVHEHAEKLAAEGFKVVVVGDAAHSEVRGILSAAGAGATAVASAKEVREAHWPEKVGVVAQTTQAAERFGEVVGAIASVVKETRAFNTICYATRDRQNAAAELAGKVDVMFVVGGKNSANTTRLHEICSKCGVPSYHVETAVEISEDWTRGRSVAGLTAGASTPDWVIEEVRRKLESL